MSENLAREKEVAQGTNKKENWPSFLHSTDGGM